MVTRANLLIAQQKLQRMLHDPKVPSKYSTDLSTVMRIVDDEAMKLRREEVFAAGAAVDEIPTGKILFEGSEIGSMERCTFYDGYASTHPDFQNPYRLTRGEPR